LSQEGSSGQILLVEDDGDLRRLIGDSLVRLGYGVTRASNLGECRAELKSACPTPDLLLVDRYLPDGDGWDVLTEMAPKGALPRIPVVVISVDQSAEAVTRALAYGAADYLVKPFESRVLAARLAAAIREARQKETLLKTQQVLARIKRELELIFDTVAESIMLLDADMTVRRINRAGMAMSGHVSYDQVVGKKCHDVMVCGEGPCSECPARQALEQQGSFEAELAREVQGRPVQLRLRAKFLRAGDAQEGLAVVVAEDVTSEREGDRERLRAEKLEAVMRLAGGLAHEISQPLAAVSGRAELLEMALAESGEGVQRSELSRHVENLRSSSRRLSEIVRRLQNISDYVTKPYYGETEILDLERSAPEGQEGEERSSGDREAG
jgi:PAS domain S-box-containing protein